MRAKNALVAVAAGWAVLAGSVVWAEGLKPGLWEITTTNKMEGANMPAMPQISAKELEQMKAMGIQLPSMGGGGGQSVTVRNCVTKEEADKALPSTQEDDGRTRCEQKDIKRDGKKVSWRVECTGEHPATGTGSMVSEGPDRYSGTTTVTSRDPQMGPMTMTSSFTGKWIADSCK